MSERAWYRSLYWRIAMGFIVFLGAMLAIQAALFLWIVIGSPSLPGRSLSDFSERIAADLSTAIERDPNVDVQAYVRRRYEERSRTVLVVFGDGRVVRTGQGRVPEGLVRMAIIRQRRGLTAGLDGGSPGRRLTAFGPVIVGGRSIATVIVLPNRPWLTATRELGPVLVVVALGLVFSGTLLAALLIFRPAHRRLRALERAAGDLGAGDLSSRAPEEGGDEIAAVARAFNRMARDLATRAEQLDASDRARRQLLADVSHELMTPLTAVRGYLETLRMPDLSLDPGTRSRYLSIIWDEAQRLERLVGDLLDLARLDAGGGALLVRPVPTQELFDRVMARHGRDAAGKHVQLSTRVLPGAETIAADPDRLEQCLQNLAANALRHTPAGGTVELGAEPAAAGHRLSVRDTGEGVPAAHLPLIFDRFYKVDASRSDASGGSGLGLSIAKAIVQRHGGRIAVRSTPGVETVFEIWLPQEAPLPSVP